MKKIGFDPQKYIEEQSKYILERVNNYDKLYLEFGGKLIGDKHAKRVLPGFDEDAKIKLPSWVKEPNLSKARATRNPEKLRKNAPKEEVAPEAPAEEAPAEEVATEATPAE